MYKNLGQQVISADRNGGRSIKSVANIHAAFNPINLAHTMSRGGVNSSGGIYDKKILEDIIDYNSPAVIRAIAQDMYDFDPICSTVADVYSSMPFSDFELSGISDNGRLQTYADVLNGVGIKNMLPDISKDYFVKGAFVGYINQDKDDAAYTSIIPYDIDMCELIFTGLYNRDPIINILIPSGLKKLIMSRDPRISDEYQQYGDQLIEMAKQQKYPLDPKNTIYYQRRSITSKLHGVSLFQRAIPTWLIEKALFRGTIDLSHRRQKSLLHLLIGTEEAIPDDSTLSAISNIFRAADSDPTGAIVATGPFVQTNEIRCLAGKTLIATDKGLIRIDELVSHDLDRIKEFTTVDININVKGINGEWIKADKWHYQGIKPTINIYTESNSKINCTENHKFYALKVGAELDLIKAKDLADEYVCIDTNGLQSNKELTLGVDVAEFIERKDNSNIRFQDYMDTSLAYIMGMIVSEGYMNKSSIQVANTDRELLNKYKEACYKVFNKTPNILDKRKKGKSFIKIKEYSTKHCYSADLNSKAIVDYLEKLGVSRSIRGTKGPAYYKVVPWSILQADSESKYAFLAAYIDADGSISNKSNATNNAVNIKICSRSNFILNNLKVMLLDMGYVSRLSYKHHCLSLNSYNASKLYNKIIPYLVTKKKHVETCDEGSHYKFGIPANVFMPVINDRFLRRQTVSKDFEAGSWFLNDEGKEVLVKNSGEILRHYKHKKSESMLLYSEFKNGRYGPELEVIRQISERLHSNLMKLFKLELRFEKVTKIKKGLVQPTYDISIEEGTAPIFVANGILVKNSGSDFWKVDELSDWANRSKLLALGANEQLVSGEVSLDLATNMLSGTLDNLRTHREDITRRVIYNKLFLNVAIDNDFRKEKADRERVTGNSRAEQIMEDYGLIISNEAYSRYVMHGSERVKMSDYDMPKIQWFKQLRPEGNEQLMQSLDALDQKGFPVPLKFYAIAAGISVAEVMRSLDEDIALRKTVAKYNARKPVDASKQVEEMFASLAEQNPEARQYMDKLKVLAKDHKPKKSFEGFQRRDPNTNKVLSRKGLQHVRGRENKIIAEAAQIIREQDIAKEKSLRKTVRRFHYS